MPSRIEDFGNGYVEEVLAPHVALHWDPATNRATAMFQMERFAAMNGVLRTRAPAGILEHAIDPAAPRLFDVPRVDAAGVPVLDGQGLPVIDQVSDVQVMVTIKACFDRLYSGE